MARPRIGVNVMTPVERQRRHRAKLHGVVDVEAVAAFVEGQFRRARAADIRRLGDRLIRVIVEWRAAPPLR